MNLLADPNHVRGDCRLIVRMLTLGTVDLDQSKAIIKRLHDLAARTEKPRELAALVNAMAKLAQVERDTVALAQRLGRGLPYDVVTEEPPANDNVIDVDTDSKRRKLIEITERVIGSK